MIHNFCCRIWINHCKISYPKFLSPQMVHRKTNNWIIDSWNKYNILHNNLQYTVEFYFILYIIWIYNKNKTWLCYLLHCRIRWYSRVIQRYALQHLRVRFGDFGNDKISWFDYFRVAVSVRRHSSPNWNRYAWDNHLDICIVASKIVLVGFFAGPFDENQLFTTDKTAMQYIGTVTERFAHFLLACMFHLYRYVVDITPVCCGFLCTEKKTTKKPWRKS